MPKIAYVPKRFSAASVVMTDPLPIPRPHRVLASCPRCGSTEFRDRRIHGGQSTRRDCALCKLTLGFPLWYGQPQAVESARPA